MNNEEQMDQLEPAVPETVPQPASEPAEEAAPAAQGGGSPDEDLRRELDAARSRVTQLERERFLLGRGIPEEDLDYYAFKSGKLVTPERDFAAAAKDFLRQRGTLRTAARSTGAELSTRPNLSPSPSDVMNQILRGK